MKKIKLIALLIALLFVISLFDSVLANANTLEEIDTVDSAIGEKVYSSATLDDEFSDNCVLLILTNEASLASFEYNASNFAEIGCASVTNLTQTTTELAKAKIAGIDVSELYSDSAVDVIPSDFYNINTSNFKQVLALELISSGKENVLAAIKTLEQRTDVYYVGPNYLYPISNSNDNAYSPLALTPADTYTAVQWAIDKIHLPDAWSICTGSASVRVGIADSGVDWQHEDLSSRASTSISVFCPSSGNYTTESQTIDITGHGTMVAGIIGATTNNNLGISGVDWNIKLASLRVAYGNDDESYSSMSALAKAIDAAIYYGIPILNISLSYPSNSDKQILRTMIQQYNGLIICCAGNNVGDIDTYNTYYPACFEFDEQNNEHDNIIVVGASTMFDEIWQGSNYGSENVDIFAPGDSIISCFPTDFCLEETNDGTRACEKNFMYHHVNGYHVASGTSFATPYVVGVAALIMAKYPSLSIAEVKERILNSVDVSSAYIGYCYTNGRLNAYKALHNHSFTNMYVEKDADYHYSYCSCGVYKTAYHNFTDIGGIYACSDCGYAS